MVSNLFSQKSDAYLSFLRNLTPQFALLSIILLIYSKLDLTRIDASNWKHTSAFYAFLIFFITAFVANTIQFISVYCGKPKQWEAQLAYIFRNENYTKFRKLSLVARTLFNRKMELIEAIFVGASVLFFYWFIGLMAYIAAANASKFFVS